MTVRSDDSRIREAYDTLRAAMTRFNPELLRELRPPVSVSVEWADRAGAQQLLALWSHTSGQARSALGALGGLSLLGPAESEAERRKWSELLTGTGIDAVTNLSWDASTSRDPTRVRAVYYAAGWIPVLSEPFEANYLAVDLVPLEDGRPGQVILCGRDEDEKCVIAPDLATLLEWLAADCASSAWEVQTTQGEPRTVKHRRGRLLSVLRETALPDLAR